MKDHVVKFFQFLEAKEGKNAPLKFKILNQDKFKFNKDELNVKGDLDLSHTNIKSLPNGLRIDRSLILRDCTLLTSLPDGLLTVHHLILEDCISLTSLPTNLYVGGDLFLDDCTSLTSLPNGLRVGGSLPFAGALSLAGCTSLKSLPDDLEVKWDLILYNCTSLTSLPKGLQVDGSLFLKNTPLAKMYSVDEIRAMIKSSGGYVNGRIEI